MKAPRSIPLKWSPALRLATIFIHVVVALATAPAEVPLWAGICVWAGCLISAVRCLQMERFARATSLLPDESGVALLKSEGRQAGQLLISSVEMGCLVVLHWQPERGESRRFVLLCDGFGREAWRELKVWLRWRVLAQ